MKSILSIITQEGHQVDYDLSSVPKSINLSQGDKVTFHQLSNELDFILNTQGDIQVQFSNDTTVQLNNLGNLLLENLNIEQTEQLTKIHVLNQENGYSTYDNFQDFLELSATDASSTVIDNTVHAELTEMFNASKEENHLTQREQISFQGTENEIEFLATNNIANNFLGQEPTEPTIEPEPITLEPINPKPTDPEPIELQVTPKAEPLIEDTVEIGHEVASTEIANPNDIEGTVTYTIINDPNGFYAIDENGIVTLTQAGVDFVNEGNDLPNFTVIANSDTGQTSNEVTVNPSDTIDTSADMDDDLKIRVAFMDDVTNAREEGHVSTKLSGVDADVVSVHVTFTDESGNQISVDAIQNEQGEWVVPDTDISSLNDGVVTVEATATDDAGNTKTTTGFFADDLEYDSTAQIDVNTSYDQENNTLKISGEVTDVESMNNVLITITDSQGNTINTYAQVQHEGTYEIIVDTSSLEEGEITTDVTVVDLAGNVAKDSHSSVIEHAEIPGITLEYGGHINNQEIETDDGDDTINMTHKEGDIKGNTNIHMHDGDDTINMRDDIEGNTYINMGEGEDTINVGDDIEGNATIDFAQGDDTLNVQTDIQEDAKVYMGEGNDVIHSGEDFEDNVLIDTGSGDDTIYMNTKDADIQDNAVVMMGEGDDSLTVGDDIQDHAQVDMGKGNDILSVGGDIRGEAQINMGEGDDTLILNDHANERGKIEGNSDIDFGSGFDSLIYDTDVTIDLSKISQNIHNVEEINLDNGHSNYLKDIAVEDIIDITDENNELYITGDENDTISFEEPNEWTMSEETITYEGETYNIWTNQDVSLYIDEDLEVEDI